MRKVLKDSHEVFHLWANQSQAEGRAGNVFFVNDCVYSYGKHFMIARHLANRFVAFTLLGYSLSTARHISQARSAARHLHAVFCANPANSVRQNIDIARQTVRDALLGSTKKGMRETTRIRMRAHALDLALKANEYLAAVRADYRFTAECEGVLPIDTSSLDAVRDDLVRLQAAGEKLRAEQRASRVADLTVSLAKWRAHELITRTGLSELPPALRVARDGLNVETSWGASITAQEAAAFWRLVMRAKDKKTIRRGDSTAVPSTVGPFRLTEIRRDGTAVIGCHTIAFAEMEGVAKALGLPT